MDKCLPEQSVLIVDLCCSWSKQVSRHFISAGFTCSLEPTLDAGEKILAERRHDILIVSDEAAKKKLVNFCNDFRSHDHRLTIIAILRDNKPIVERRLFDVGVDDVVHGRTHSKTFVKRAFVRIHVRRILHVDNELCNVGDSIIDYQSYRVWNRGKELSISKSLLELLKYLMLNRGRAVSRKEASEILWADSVVDPEGKNLDMQIMKLRRLIEKDPKSPKVIQTVPGIGYMLSSNA